MRALVLACVIVGGCAAADPANEGFHPLDRVSVGADGKADGATSRFDRDRIISDAVFTDTATLGAVDVQVFLEATPYDGQPSFLAGEVLGSGETFAEALVRIARAYQLNPLVLLATLQKEAGLVSRVSSPNGQRVAFALGCGCHDGVACMPTFSGLDKQLECAAELLRHSYDMGTARLPTRGGYEIASILGTLDGVDVFTSNRATLSLYTYSPWVTSNALFWSIMRRYAAEIGYLEAFEYPFNEGFIGGLCEIDADCFFPGGTCAYRPRAPNGTCTAPCDRFCPDRNVTGYAATFCTTVAGVGQCAARCSTDLTSPLSCPNGNVCVPQPRHGEPTVIRNACEF